jgi:hypothetical protein
VRQAGGVTKRGLLARAPPRSEPALSLAALRIAVCLLIPVAPGFREGARIARWDPVRWVAPEGLGWFAAHVPISGWLATSAQVVVAASALFGALGLSARWSLVVLTLSTLYLYSISQLGGHVWHDMHLIWFAALLAASPCADVLAVDAKKSLYAEGVEYARPLAVARGLLSIIYFFPGLHKLTRSGLAWALSDNLRNQMYWKWAEYGVVPSFRIDHPAWILPMCGLSVLAFELSFPLLVFFRRTRPLAAIFGLAFHLLAQALFFIPFASIWACYVVLLDLRPFARWVQKNAGPTISPEPRPAAPPTAVLTGVGIALLLGALVQGIRGQMRSYPFACYPTFEWRIGTEIPDLLIAVTDTRGAEIELGSGAHGRTQRDWAEVWSLTGVTAPATEPRLHAYYEALLRRDPAARKAAEEATSVRFYRVDRSVLPETQGAVVRRRAIP